MNTEMVPISELAEVNPKTEINGLTSDSLVSFIPMADVTESGYWVGRQVRHLRDVRVGYTAFAEDDVLFAKITPCMENGKGAHVNGLVNGIGFGSTEFHVLRAKNHNDSRYIFHWLQTKQTRLRAIAYMGGSAGQQRVQKDFFVNYRVPEIAPAEQSRIAYILDTIDEAIAQTEAVIAKLKKVRAGMLHDLLSYGLDEHDQLRDPIAHPEQFKDSPLGLIPKDWEPKSLGILCSHIGSGVTPRGGQDVYTKEGILFVRSQNVTFDGLKLDDIAYIPRHIHIGMLRSEVFAHDVLFNITGASIGRCCAMPGNMGIANVNQHVCILRIPAATESDAVFLSTVLSSKIGQKQLETLNTCGNRQGLNYQQLGSFIVPWPESEERGLIAGHVKKTAVSLSAEISELKKLRSLKIGLQDDLLTGRVRVPNPPITQITQIENGEPEA